MTFSRHVLAAAFLTLVAAAPAHAAGGAGADAQQAPDSRLELAMTLYAGGLTMGAVNLDATVRGSQYHIVSNLETTGVVNAFWKAQIQATASGSLDAATLSPALYDSYSVNRAGKKQQISLTYTSGVAPRLFADPVYSTTGYEVKTDEQKGTVDPLSAVISIVAGAGGANACTLVAPVFDGRRRYNIEMSKVRDTDIKMDNHLYQGKGVLCQAHYKQVAGYKPTVLKARDSYPVINALMATFRSGSRQYTVPLRVWADTSYGTVAAVANTLKIDGAAPRS